MSQIPRLSACPSCAEPLDPGDRFCGACGYDLSAVPAPPGDHPTVTLHAAGRAATAPAEAERPTPPPAAAPSPPPPPPPLVPPVAAGAGDRPPVVPPGPAARPADAAAPLVPPSDPAPPVAPPPVSGGGVRFDRRPGWDGHGQPPGAGGFGGPPGAAPGEGQAAGAPGGGAFGPPPTAGAFGPPASGEPFGGSGFRPATDESGFGQPGGGSGVVPPAGDGGFGPPALSSGPAGSPYASQDGGATPYAGQPAPTPPDPAPSAPSGSDEYALQAPDPRIAADPAPQAPAAAGQAPETAAARMCVACRAGRVDGDGYCENCGHAQPRERDHMEQDAGAVAAVSDRGLRHHRNEDAFAVARTALPDGSPATVAIVCDGVSSATRPDDASLAASRAASEALLTALPQGTHPQQAMHEAIVAASRAVDLLADEPATAREQGPHQNAPACTLVGSVVTPGLLVVGWVGDSRAYWIPSDRSAPPARLTEDDSWAAQMVAAGLMNEAEAYADDRAHAITGWLGADAYELDPHTASFKPEGPGVVVVCTDGLWNYAEAAEDMARVVPADASDRPLHSARVLVGHALDGGGHDNVTVAVVPFPAVCQGAGSA